MAGDYFGHDIALAAANDYVFHRFAYDLTFYAIAADADPEWELEVVVAYLDRSNGLSAKYPKMPHIV